MSTRTLRGDNGNSPTAADIEMETMPDLAQGFADEEETWNKLQLIRTLPVDMAKKRELKAEIMVMSGVEFSIHVYKMFTRFLSVECSHV